MSAYTFPALPGVSVDVQRTPFYRTTTLETWSGKEVRLARQSSARVRIRLQVNFLRDTVAAPSPWAAYSELGIVKYFHTIHKGSWDSFSIADPDGGATLTVRFESDELNLAQVVPNVWSGEIILVTVL